MHQSLSESFVVWGDASSIAQPCSTLLCQFWALGDFSEGEGERTRTVAGAERYAISIHWRLSNSEVLRREVELPAHPVPARSPYVAANL